MKNAQVNLFCDLKSRFRKIKANKSKSNDDIVCMLDEDTAAAAAEFVASEVNADEDVASVDDRIWLAADDAIVFGIVVVGVVVVGIGAVWVVEYGVVVTVFVVVPAEVMVSSKSS